MSGKNKGSLAVIFLGIKIILIRKYLVSKLRVTLQINCFVAMYEDVLLHTKHWVFLNIAGTHWARGALIVTPLSSGMTGSWTCLKFLPSVLTPTFWVHPLTEEIRIWGQLAGAQPARCWIALHKSWLHLYHCACYQLQAGLWVHRAQASHLLPRHTPCSLRL